MNATPTVSNLASCKCVLGVSMRTFIRSQEKPPVAIVKFIEKYTKGSEVIKDEKDCFKFALRKTVHTDCDTFIRWTIVGRNMKAIY